MKIKKVPILVLAIVSICVGVFASQMMGLSEIEVRVVDEQNNELDRFIEIPDPTSIEKVFIGIFMTLIIFIPVSAFFVDYEDIH